MRKHKPESKLRRETLDNIANVIANLPKSREDWKAFYGTTTLTEDHARGDVELHVHICWRVGINLPNLCAVFVRSTGMKDHGRCGPKLHTIALKSETIR